MTDTSGEASPTRVASPPPERVLWAGFATQARLETYAGVGKVYFRLVVVE